jgi:hypothetical protein
MHATRHFVILTTTFSLLFGGCSKKPSCSITISDEELIVRGLSDAELKQIIGDFQQMYHDNLPQTSFTRVYADNDGILRVTFPTAIDSEYYYSLINYIRYPIKSGAKSRTVIVAGRATITSDFLPAHKSLIGERITFYIPTDDIDHNAVFASVAGQSYLYQIKGKRWFRVQGPKFPVGFGDLK